MVKIPVEMDVRIVEQAAALGLSYQAAAREAFALWLEENSENRPQGE